MENITENPIKSQYSNDVATFMFFSTLDLFTYQNCCTDRDIPKKSNCKNCGASLSGRHICEYCGTYNV